MKKTLLLTLLLCANLAVSQSDSKLLENKDSSIRKTGSLKGTEKVVDSTDIQYQQKTIPTNYKDSLSLAYSMIDEMGISDLTKQRERFIYKVRIESYSLNSEILAYIEKRIKLLSK